MGQRLIDGSKRGRGRQRESGRDCESRLIERDGEKNRERESDGIDK